MFVYVTTPTREQAERIARAVVDERLAACANILPHMTSVYRWGGAVQCESEVVLLFKTVNSRYAELVAKVKALHPYECPCVVMLPIAGGSAQFLNWVNVETQR